jgi:oxalate decarboxylase/phosphoglucose isomerase-like protein (cupin superfamily)
MHLKPQPIAEWTDVTEEVFRNQIATQYQPAVLRGLVKRWPVVQQAQESDLAVCRYLAEMDAGTLVDVIMTPPETQGRVFYNTELTGFNYVRNQLPLTQVMEQVLRYAVFPNPPAVAVQSALLSKCAPAFEAAHGMPLLPATVHPRIWLGNCITTPAHIDESNNIACVVAGKRRFTLFPPEEISNLYLGPLDYTPTGSPISMVDFAQPDFERFPNFRHALAAAQVAELEPGDAIYIPSLWWHHVQSLAKVNVLVNYWWRAGGVEDDKFRSAFDALMLALVHMKDLPAPYRKAWGDIFKHYIFESNPEQQMHIPIERRGVLGEISPQHEAQVRAWLAGRLKP